MYLLEAYIYWPDVVLIFLGAFTVVVLLLVLLQLKKSPGTPPPADVDQSLTYTLFFTNAKIKASKMAVTLKSIEEVTGQVTPTNKKGKPAPVQAGSVEFSSADENIATIEEDPSDETKFKIVAHNPGVTQINFKADADLGDGVVEISGFAAVEVLPAEATGFGVTFGTPTEQE